MTNAPTILERNILSLAASRGNLIDRVRASSADPSLRIEISKTGKAIPCVDVQGTIVPLHSRYDPEREGQRIAEGFPGTGFYLCAGLGGAYHLRALLSRAGLTGLIVVERNMGLFRALLEGIDLSDVFSDPRVEILVDPDPRDLENALFGSYIPALSGALRTMVLRPRVELDRPGFQGIVAELESLIARVSDDFTVQSHFGMRWFANTVRNLRTASGHSPPLPPVRTALVAAAGPSLETQLDAIKAAQSRGAFLISTDTALPFLTQSGLRPGAVVTIDCQHISYYHFMRGYPSGVPLIMDLASPPIISRLAAPICYFSSGHPFCRFVSNHFRAFPRLDTSGGNVTHAALSLSEILGAREIRLFGADFSYPLGKTYARGTYIYPYFDYRSGRFSPIESRFSDFLFQNANMEREPCPGGFRYLTKPLISYKLAAERLGSSLEAAFRPEPGLGAPLKAAAPSDRPGYEGASTLRKVFSPGPVRVPIGDFLDDYRRGLRSLKIPEPNAYLRMAALPSRERDLWMTILPIVPVMVRKGLSDPGNPAQALERSRDWAIAALDRL
jgi:hypothetical protein